MMGHKPYVQRILKLSINLCSFSRYLYNTSSKWGYHLLRNLLSMWLSCIFPSFAIKILFPLIYWFLIYTTLLIFLICFSYHYVIHFIWFVIGSSTGAADESFCYKTLYSKEFFILLVHLNFCIRFCILACVFLKKLELACILTNLIAQGKSDHSHLFYVMPWRIVWNKLL